MSTLKRIVQEAPNGPVIVVATVLALGIGCSGGEAPPEDEASPPEEVEIEDVNEEFQEAAETLGAWTYDQRDDFAEWGQRRLDDIDHTLGELRTGVEEMGDEASAEWHSTLRELEAERDRLASELEAAADSTEAAWDEIQSGFVVAQQELTDAIERAAEELVATGEVEQDTEEKS